MSFFDLTKPHAPGVRRQFQVIGTRMMRPSGIQMSRSAYTIPLKRLYPDLIESSYSEALRNTCDINLWAVRGMQPKNISDIKRCPGKNIWCIVLESSELQPGVKDAAEQMDQLWVPTTFVKDVCVAGGIPENKIRIIPYYLPPPPRARVLPGDSDPFTVLVSWDDASNMERKNVVNSIKAFKKAFPKEPNVRLRLKTRDLRESNAILIIDAINDDDRIELRNGFVNSVDEVFDGVHVLFHIHRAEGYGRHTIEAMQRGLPLISTRYSGCMDWLTDLNSYLVDYTLVLSDQKLFQYPIDGLWADPSIDQAVEALRHCRENYSGSVQSKVTQAKEDAARATSMFNVLEQMRQALRSI